VSFQTEAGSPDTVETTFFKKNNGPAGPEADFVQNRVPKNEAYSVVGGPSLNMQEREPAPAPPYTSGTALTFVNNPT